jgi:hypothetical protein
MESSEALMMNQKASSTSGLFLLIKIKIVVVFERHDRIRIPNGFPRLDLRSQVKIGFKSEEHMQFKQLLGS